MLRKKEKNFWLIKFAPFRTSWDEIVRRGTFTLRGVRNYQARNNLKEMRLNDPVLFYHSQHERAVVGLMKVTKTSFPDPTSFDKKWLTCTFAPEKTFFSPVTLKSIRSNKSLKNMGLIKQPRVAVLSLTEEEFEVIIKMGVESWKTYDLSAKDVENKKDELIDQVQAKLEQKVTRDHLFTIKWSVI